MPSNSGFDSINVTVQDRGLALLVFVQLNLAEQVLNAHAVALCGDREHGRHSDEHSADDDVARLPTIEVGGDVRGASCKTLE